MKLSPQFVSLYKKLKKRYPGKSYEGYQQAILWNSLELYPNFSLDYYECDRVLDKMHQRRKRIRKYVRRMFENKGYNVPVLVSLTFTDDVLESTSFETRKRYVQDYLNSDIFTDYFACVDYGKVNQREHYHAIALLNYRVKHYTFLKKRRLFLLPVYSLLDWPFGFYSIRPLEVDPSDCYRTLNYAFKSSAYAFKSSEGDVKPFHKRSCWLYSPCDEHLF